MDYPLDSNTHIQTDWALQRYAQFVKLMNDIKPKLVVIDSLIGCSGGRAFDENKSDFATPLYWLTRNNGVLFPATTILVVHHANKQGGFRGTSAIRDAVDETIRLAKPSKDQVEKGIAPGHSRLLTIEKSRSGRSGTSLIMQMEADLSFSIADFTPEVDATNTSPSGITDRVLQRLRVIYPRTMSRTDLNSDHIVGGKVAAIRKSLQRLVKRGLIEVVCSAPAPDGKNSFDIYRAVLARGEVGEMCPTLEEPSPGAESGVGHKVGHSPISDDVSHPESPEPDQGGTLLEILEECPIPKPSPGAESAKVGHSEQYPRAREEERTLDELRASKDSAWDMWSA